MFLNTYVYILSELCKLEINEPNLADVTQVNTIPYSYFE